MSKITRFGVSLEPELLKELDKVVRANRFGSRSQALRNIIREKVVKHECSSGNKETAGTITLVYNHHKRNLMDSLTDAQHKYHHLIISTQHIHLDHDNCMEVIVVKGKPSDVQRLLLQLRSIRGVKFASLSTATITGKHPL